MCIDLFKLLILIHLLDFISTQDYHVLNFGAIGDGVTNDTKAVRDALAAANNSNGGRVIFDAGYKFLTGPFNITNNVILDVRGIIIASSNRSDYFLIQEVPWWGNYERLHPIVHTYNVSNITITGGGIIDGQGDYWYNCSVYNKTLPPCDGQAGPFLAKLVYTTDILIENITFLNSPRWTLDLAYATNVYVNQLNITAPSDRIVTTGWGINNDGIDIDCSVNVTIENSYYNGGDDAIIVKSGYREQGAKYGRTSENITVRNIVVGVSDGIGVGVEIAAGVRNVTFQNISLNGSVRGINVQSERLMGGFIEDITFSDIRMYNVNHTFQMSLYYKYYPNDTNTPKYKNIILNNIIADNSNYVWWLSGLPESNLENLYLNNITITNTRKEYIYSCTHATGICHNTTVFPYCPPCLGEESCFDASSECGTYLSLCNAPSYHSMMCDQCRKTCKLCNSC